MAGNGRTIRSIGKTDGRYHILLKLVAIRCVLISPLIFTCACAPDRREDPAITAKLKEITEAAIAREARDRADCLENRASKVAEHRRLMARGEFMEAYGAVANCGKLTADADLNTLADQARIADLEASAKNPKNSASDRLIALDALRREYPDKIGGTEKLFDTLTKAQALEKRAERSKRGVTIGMTQAEVLESSWGKPSNVNRTIRASGVTEQWVYPGGSYLYFTDGKLDTIQN